MATENTNYSEDTPENVASESKARRDFLKKAGRFAAVTPPAITLLLGTSLNSSAIAKSGGSRPVNGSGGSHPGNGSGGGPPGKIHHFSQGRSESRSDSYGGGSHGGSRSGDPN
ncbi:MAG: hypothetical protein ABIQ51_22845 [Mesorhizobium sp.]